MATDKWRNIVVVPYDAWDADSKARWMKMTTWQTKGGTRYVIADMKKSHIENTIMLLFRSGYDIPDEFYRVLRERERWEKQMAEAEAKIMPEYLKQMQKDASWT